MSDKIPYRENNTVLVGLLTPEGSIIDIQPANGMGNAEVIACEKAMDRRMNVVIFSLKPEKVVRPMVGVTSPYLNDEGTEIEMIYYEHKNMSTVLEGPDHED